MCFHLGTGPLRVGVGDVPAAPSTSGSGDVEDWALFAPLSGNGAGDFSGSNTWCFGGEFRANDGYNGTTSPPCLISYQGDRVSSRSSGGILVPG